MEGGRASRPPRPSVHSTLAGALLASRASQRPPKKASARITSVTAPWMMAGLGSRVTLSTICCQSAPGSDDPARAQARVGLCPRDIHILPTQYTVRAQRWQTGRTKRQWNPRLYQEIGTPFAAEYGGPTVSHNDGRASSHGRRLPASRTI